MWNAHMRFSRFELRGRLKTEKLFQRPFLSTSRHSNQTKADPPPHPYRQHRRRYFVNSITILPAKQGKDMVRNRH